MRPGFLPLLKMDFGQVLVIDDAGGPLELAAGQRLRMLVDPPLVLDEPGVPALPRLHVSGLRPSHRSRPPSSASAATVRQHTVQKRKSPVKQTGGIPEEERLFIVLSLMVGGLGFEPR